MKSNTANWPYRWFGIWKEYGKGFEQFPSAKDFVDNEINALYNKSLLIHYLQSGQVIASTTRYHFPNPFTGKRTKGSISYRTDGEWVWLDDLADYIEHHNLIIPNNWFARIVAANYQIPHISNEQIDNLEWPS